MIKNEADIGIEVDQRNRLGYLMRQNAEIEGEPRIAEPIQIFAKSAPSETSSGTTCSTRRKPLTNGSASTRSR